MPRVLISDKLGAAGVELLRQAGVEVDERHGPKDAALREALQTAGATLGVVGLGRVGREVARRAAGLDMKVIGYDPVLAPERAAQLGVAAVAGLEQLLPQVDFLTVHTPLTDETRNLIGAAEIAQL